MKFTRRQLTNIVRKTLTEQADVKQEDAKDELSSVITKLGLGQKINKQKLVRAMTTSDRSRLQDNIIAEFFIAILNAGDDITRIFPLLKSAAKKLKQNESSGDE
mgnify:CR=1 FL=1